ncbi:hypothetical protein [Paenibacillus shenyangensis]|uniref:hypothetical protein n=1 Tax=Paenibacillus sp. A9 TaxID=1284352 RepID=UPI0003646785|nr:hypothetical protein [Paenibacillus sp. A9]
MNTKAIYQLLWDHQITLAPGLSDKEVSQIESIYNIQFPPDLQELLQYMLPIGRSFPIWRDFSKSTIADIRRQLDAPLEGILFDIEHNQFWHHSWGTRPNNLKEAQKIACQEYLKVPPLIPVYGHRYIPSTPAEVGNPVLSVHQTDIIYYGSNLEEYFKIEYRLKAQSELDDAKIKYITFWSQLIEG